MANDGGLPVRWRWAVAHIVVVALAVVYGHTLPGGIAPILLTVALPLALETSPLRDDAAYASWLMMALAGAVALWLLSENAHPAYEGFPAMLSAVTAAGFLTRLHRTGPRRFLLLLAVQVALVAYFSSGRGGSGAMVHWLVAQGLSDAQAHSLTLAFRKTVHFTFYGTVGWTALQAARGSGAERNKAVRTALLAALAVASFDELRQSGYANRTASAWDVLLDLAGAFTFVGLSVFRETRKR